MIVPAMDPTNPPHIDLKDNNVHTTSLYKQVCAEPDHERQLFCIQKAQAAKATAETIFEYAKSAFFSFFESGLDPVLVLYQSLEDLNRARLNVRKIIMVLDRLESPELKPELLATQQWIENLLKCVAEAFYFFRTTNYTKLMICLHDSNHSLYS